MYVKNSNFAIYLVLAALVGFGVSFLFHSSDAQSSLLSGDISKASVYSNHKDDPEVTAIEEKLKNDEEFFNATKATVSLIEARATSLEDLTEKTLDICADIPELKNVIKTVVSLNAKAYNTKQFAITASNGLDKLASGKKAPEYEQASNSVFIGFNRIDSQLSIGKAFVESALNYLEGKDGEEYYPIAELVAEWTMYCAENSFLMENDDMTYWVDEITDLAYSDLIGESPKYSLGENMKHIVGENLKSVAGENLKSVAGENLKSVAGENLKTIVGESLKSVAGENLKSIAGESLKSVVGENLKSVAGENLKSVAGENYRTE